MSRKSKVTFSGELADAADVVAPVVVSDSTPAPDVSDEFELDGHRYRRIHRLEGNRWIDRCERIG